METINILDLETRNTTEIPASELAPGYIQARIEGSAETVFVKAAAINKSAPPRHPPFSPEVRKTMERFATTFSDVHPITAERWEYGFRQDQNPAKEIALWCLIENAFKHFTEGKHLPLAAKQDYFNIILSVVNNGSAIALELVSLRKLSRRRARSVVAWLTRNLS